MNKLLSSVTQTVLLENYDKNIVFSPVSYLEAVHSLALCASEKNLAEILDGLGIKQEDLMLYLRQTKTSFSIENYNCLLYSEEYRGVIRDVVLTALRTIGSDLQSFSSPDEAINRVNTLVREKTHGKIDNIADRSLINEFTKFIILNCVYFKKDWRNEFEQRDYTELFHGKNKTPTKYLHDRSYLKYYEDADIDIVEIPYKDSSVNCYLFVPRHSLLGTIHNFDTFFAKIKEVKKNWEVDITVPAFKTETTIRLNDHTKIAGLKNIFEHTKDWNLIDFDKLLPETLVWVQQIIQKAYIDFTKRGTEATAVTAIFMGISGCYSMNFTPPPIKFIRADKPFLYCLVDEKNQDVPLFVGLINDL